MNIRYVKSNLNKLYNDNLIKFLYDITLQDTTNIDSYEEGKIYNLNEKIYLQNDNVHQVFQCIVSKSSGLFIDNEWEHILDITYDSIEKISNLIIKEEMFIIDETTINGIQTKLDFIQENSTFALYCGKKRYCINHDFKVDKKVITFNKPFNIGDKIILEVREFIGIPDGLVLRSTNGLVYEAFIFGDDLFIGETNKSGREEILIKDTYDEKNYKLFMEDEDVFYDLTTVNTTKTDIEISDEMGIRRKMTMIDGELYFEVFYRTGLVMESTNGNKYNLCFKDGCFMAIETESNEYVTELFIRDKETMNVIRLYMEDKEIVCESVEHDTDNMEIKVYDEYNDEYIINLVNNEFIVSQL